MGPRTSLDGRKSRPTGIRSPDRPACSQSLYRLSYPGHLIFTVLTKFIKEIEQPIPGILKIKVENLSWLIAVPIKFLESNSQTSN